MDVTTQSSQSYKSFSHSYNSSSTLGLKPLELSAIFGGNFSFYSTVLCPHENCLHFHLPLPYHPLCYTTVLHQLVLHHHVTCCYLCTQYCICIFLLLEITPSFCCFYMSILYISHVDFIHFTCRFHTFPFM